MESSRDRVFWALVALSLLSVLPLFLVERPPSHDLPQHLAAVHMLRVYPEQGLGDALELDPWRSQYIGFYSLAVLLSYPFGVLLGTKLLIAAIGLAIPWGLWTLLGALGRDRRLAFFALPLVLNVCLLFGLYNYVAGIALALFAWAAAIKLREDSSHTHRTRLGGIVCLMVFTHPAPIVLAITGSCLLLLERDLRKTIANLAVLLPGLALFIAWLLNAKAASFIVEEQPLGRAPPFTAALRGLPSWLGCSLRGPLDEVLFFVWAAVIVLVVFPAARRTRDARLWSLGALAGLCWGFYFFLPTKHGWIYPVGPRFALPAALLSIAILPSFSAAGARRFMPLLGVLAIAQSTALGLSFFEVSREEGDIMRALSMIPEGKHVAGLIFDQDSRVVNHNPFRHYTSLYQSLKGGIVSRSFVGTPTSPFSFRKACPTQPPWSAKAADIDPVADFTSFDYLLVRGGALESVLHKRTPHQASSGEGGPSTTSVFERIFDGTRWDVYWRRVARVQ